MKALRLLTHGRPGVFEFVEVPDPDAQPEEVVVEVRACGLNHLDLWLEQGALPLPPQLPRIPGCVIAGVVESVGRDGVDWKRGEAVAVQSNLFCGRCEFCLRGRESLCLEGQLLGVQRDGGFATRVVVPGRALVRLPPGVDFKTSAALTLAGSTAMHMLTRRARVNSGDWVLVMGAASGVGSAAIHRLLSVPPGGELSGVQQWHTADARTAGGVADQVDRRSLWHEWAREQGQCEQRQ